MKISIDNISYLPYEQAMHLIKETCIKQFPTFTSTYKQEQYADTYGHWGIKLSKGDFSFSLGSDRSFIDYTLILKGEPVYLGDFDNRVVQLKTTSENNFIILIDVIKRYLELHTTE